MGPGVGQAVDLGPITSQGLPGGATWTPWRFLAQASPPATRWKALRCSQRCHLLRAAGSRCLIGSAQGSSPVPVGLLQVVGQLRGAPRGQGSCGSGVVAPWRCGSSTAEEATLLLCEHWRSGRSPGPVQMPGTHRWVPSRHWHTRWELQPEGRAGQGAQAGCWELRFSFVEQAGLLGLTGRK